MKKINKITNGAAMSHDYDSLTTYGIKKITNLVFDILESEYDYSQLQMSQNTSDWIEAYWMDEGKEARTFHHAEFVAMRIFNEAKAVGLQYELTPDDFVEAMAGYWPSDEAWNKYIEPQLGTEKVQAT
jgi:hypothetical protein